MLDWAILIGCTLLVLVLMWKGYRYLRRTDEDDAADAALVVQEPAAPSTWNMDPGAVNFVDRLSADDIARRVHDHERARERQERADALLQAVTMGHRPDEDEIEFLNEHFHGTRVNSAISTGMWSSTMKAIEDLTRDLEDMRAQQPTLIVAEMPERVG